MEKGGERSSLIFVYLCENQSFSPGAMRLLTHAPSPTLYWKLTVMLVRLVRPMTPKRSAAAAGAARAARKPRASRPRMVLRWVLMLRTFLVEGAPPATGHPRPCRATQLCLMERHRLR